MPRVNKPNPKQRVVNSKFKPPVTPAKTKKTVASPNAPSPMHHAALQHVVDDSPNSNYHACLATSYTALTEAFQSIVGLPALPIDDEDGGMCGFIAPFDKDVYDAQYDGLAMGNSYTCGLPLFALDIHNSVTPYIPLSEKRVRSLIPLHFDHPSQFPYTITIAVDFSDGAALVPGIALQSLLPLEITHAMIFAIADALPTMQPDTKIAWEKTLRSLLQW